MTTSAANIRFVLEDLQYLPTPVSDWLVKTGLDATDDPAVWVWAVIERDDVDHETLARLKDMVRERIRRETDGQWAYILIRGAWESQPAF